ncbi:MAG: hypothetical protein ISR91_03470 [Candidatus Delongbacteria bacterium]|nr:hypothetical protein [bacterium]MBL7033182.1 hypothetical protein [Candidatus Delongbacteria bacterium]
MKRLSLILAITLFAGLALATQVLVFRGVLLSESAVDLQWTVDDETGLSSFQLHRSADGITYEPIAAPIPADGSLSYSHVDTPMGFTGDETSRVYFYSLYLIDPQGQSQQGADPIEITFEISGVAMTWGTLKAMFR